MKKYLALLVVLSLLGSFLPAAALAQGQQANSIELEKAIGIAKSCFQIPKEYDQFDSSYEQNEFTNVWSLRWYPTKGYGEINVRIDANSGEIAGYNYYNPKDYEGQFSSLPKISKKDGEQIALDFIKKVASSKAGEIVLKPNRQYYYGGPVFHTYYFNRVIGGIEYPANNISVEVNGQTGEVRSFYVNWERLNAAPSQAKLAPADAEKIFNEKFGFELKYFRPYPENRVVKPVKLIYEIVNPYQVTIDALSGEIVEEDNYYPYFSGKDEAYMYSQAENRSTIEPFEQKIVDELKGLISKDQALAIAQNAVAIPSSFQLRYSQLSRDWEFPDLKIWSFNWNVEEKNHYGWASVEVDAQTGKVIAFNYNEDYYNEAKQPEKSLLIKNRGEAEKIVQNYLKQNFPEVVDNLRPQKEFMEEIYLKTGDNSDKDQPSYYLNYERVVNGIPYRNNFVTATVNSYTGKISDFRIRFLDHEFPKTDNVLEKTQFVSDYFAKNPLNLVYVKDRDKNMRLVYKLASVESYRFDAVTGEMLGWNGEPLKDKTDQSISDIQGHWAEKDILTLHELGLLNVVDGEFKPENSVTQAELIKMLVKISNNYLTDAASGNWYDHYYQRAKESGLILENEIKPEAPVTRQELAKFLVRTLMWDKIAALDIYQLKKYEDAASIAKGYLGYVAVASELGLITGDGTNWKPLAEVKKGEACVIIVRYLKMEKSRVY